MFRIFMWVPLMLTLMACGGTQKSKSDNKKSQSEPLANQAERTAQTVGKNIESAAQEITDGIKGLSDEQVKKDLKADLARIETKINNLQSTIQQKAKETQEQLKIQLKELKEERTQLQIKLKELTGNENQ